MLRLVEVVLFLAPFALYGVWYVFGRHISPRLMWVAVIGLMVISVATVWFGLERSLSRGEAYVPARIVNGQIVQGHGVPR